MDINQFESVLRISALVFFNVLCVFGIVFTLFLVFTVFQISKMIRKLSEKLQDMLKEGEKIAESVVDVLDSFKAKQKNPIFQIVSFILKNRK